MRNAQWHRLASCFIPSTICAINNNDTSDRTWAYSRPHHPFLLTSTSSIQIPILWLTARLLSTLAKHPFVWHQAPLQVRGSGAFLHAGGAPLHLGVPRNGSTDPHLMSSDAFSTLAEHPFVWHACGAPLDLGVPRNGSTDPPFDVIQAKNRASLKRKTSHAPS